MEFPDILLNLQLPTPLALDVTNLGRNFWTTFEKNKIALAGFCRLENLISVTPRAVVELGIIVRKQAWPEHGSAP
ncbi:hypothetical protein SADUNF_Sadunf08G0008500 [Salix dunnii]|uniref:Uncharacterized protein n=1 Tax=Salix dunnii TaxID=1413687 RepID=A0A835JXK9_9ROSI|nr:hypothetical protein SADUNF_Sadunf08G0008500 [Salix dunnii]